MEGWDTDRVEVRPEEQFGAHVRIASKQPRAAAGWSEEEQECLPNKEGRSARMRVDIMIAITSRGKSSTMVDDAVWLRP